MSGPPIGSICPKCEGRWPDERYRIADLGASVAYLHDDQYFPGWTVLVLERHATELWHLAERERATLIEDVSAVARAVAEEFSSVKMNYALLGNQIGHVHWHLIPRLSGDPAPKIPVWAHGHPAVVPGDAERTERIARIRARLGR
ncbi:MAG: HIT family protein [Candidatus Rokubacteria bacterium]|nr:HIT family protein [Candidatus Rokubacteria bacterium]